MGDDPTRDTGNKSVYTRPALVVFFVSFHIISGWFLLQIIVAVLYDNFVRAIEEETMANREHLAFSYKPLAPYHPLDQVLDSLAAADDEEQLAARLHDLFSLVLSLSGDCQQPATSEHGSRPAKAQTAAACRAASGVPMLSRRGLRQGLEALPILPQLKISEDFLDVLLEDVGKGADAGAAGAPVMSEEAWTRRFRCLLHHFACHKLDTAILEEKGFSGSMSKLLAAIKSSLSLTEPPTRIAQLSSEISRQADKQVEVREGLHTVQSAVQRIETLLLQAGVLPGISDDEVLPNSGRTSVDKEK